LFDLPVSWQDTTAGSPDGLRRACAASVKNGGVWKIGTHLFFFQLNKFVPNIENHDTTSFNKLQHADLPDGLPVCKAFCPLSGIKHTSQPELRPILYDR
jgi:hypothetical protein